MEHPEKLPVKHSSQMREWTTIGISVIALGLSGFEFCENHEQSIPWDMPMVEVEQSLDTDLPLIGIKIVNVGTAPAIIKDITFYLDRKPSEVDEVIEEGNLTNLETTKFDDNHILGTGETEWLLSKRTNQKKGLDYFADFIDKHVAVQTTVCSITTGKCETQCSANEWCK